MSDISDLFASSPQMIDDMSFAEYLTVDAFSSSAMKKLDISPWHYKNQPARSETAAMRGGTLAHCAALEPDALATRYVTAPDDAPRKPTRAQQSAKNPSPSSVAAMAWWEDFEAASEGKIVTTRGSMGLAQMQVDALRREPEIAARLSGGQPEVSIFWVDRATKVRCKARLDYLALALKSAVVTDIKSTADESPRGFGRSLTKLGYHRQQAHYEAAVEAVLQMPTNFCFAAVTSSAPPLAVLYRLDDISMRQAHADRGRLLNLYASCNESGEWPAYGTGPHTISIDSWAIDDQLEI